MNTEIEKLKVLIDLVTNSGITELEVSSEKGGVLESIRINNGKVSPGNVNNAVAPLMVEMANVATSALPAQKGVVVKQSSSNIVVSEGKEVKHHTVNAPMVGTVYLSSAPGTKSFVEIGQQVKVGDTLCLIEAMKMFNRIEADRSGLVTARLIENAQPVEYGQALFIIE